MAPSEASSQTFYRCIDEDGYETIADHPQYGQSCKSLQSHEEPKSTRQDEKGAAKGQSPDAKKTKIIVRGNRVLVPASIAYGDREVQVHLVIDTGAAFSVINSDISDQLYIKLYNAPKVKARVVGGAMIDVSVIRLKSITIGPHTIPDCHIAVVVNEGDDTGYDGLLGMDILAGYSFRIDLANQVIVWM